ncbi:SDR family oxidoreductase [Rhodocaloribacter litoris]|uniref:SDR family oxidoreductase n=1 Tax=Rhodocaloribacter litoris TaxID=2558931 RepID=UPI00141EF44B|nr:SDR family oxidoreductase [Rhodocaloribacter litoris]QXD14221.1 SDR family oxidoreductase [Rhodocaloribacter litoris]
MPASTTRFVLVTGASTGIGRACALDLAAHGFSVFATVRRAEDARALEAEGLPHLRPLFLDVTDGAAIAAAAGTVGTATGEAGLWGLVNNAGIVLAAPLEAIPLDAFRRQLEVNVTGQLAVTQAFLPLVRRARGRIVNMGSIGGISVIPFVGAYCASKFALEAISDALRMELAPWGIEVVIVEPGTVTTPIWRKGEEAADAILSRIDPGVVSLYREAMERMRRVVAAAETRGAPPEVVAAAVRHALTARRPKTRYLVGPVARMRWVLQRLLPDRLRDRLLRRLLA